MASHYSVHTDLGSAYCEPDLLHFLDCNSTIELPVILTSQCESPVPGPVSP